MIELTDPQKALVTADGDFLLIACPGSGKTRTGAARVGALAAAGKKVAVCSYTNVGADRIGAVMSEMGIRLGPEHFIGTLHSFLLRYVVYPFGLSAGCAEGPHLVQSPEKSVAYKGNHKTRVDIDALRMRPDGTLVLHRRPQHLSHITHEEITAAVGGEVIRVKANLLRAGYVSFDDAMYLALRVLREAPELAAALAGRFDEILLDEAQDTSELQLACLDELKSTGRLGSLVLVGDLEQSIFAFSGASADRCQKLADAHELRTEELTQNHRCSQLICNVAVHFCERDAPDEAVGQHRDCSIAPEVILYPPGDPAAAVETFRARLKAHDADPAGAAVLARGNTLVLELNGGEGPVAVAERPMTLGRAVAALRHGTLTRTQLDRVQRIVSYAAWDETVLDRLSVEQREVLRRVSIRFLIGLASLDDDLREWIKEAAGQLRQALELLADPAAHKAGQVLISKATHSGTVAREVFMPEAVELRAQTVHDVKGEDRDAVMVVIDRPRSSRHGAQAELWGSALAGGDIEEKDAEEKRIAFVALTRAERICVVALPDDDGGRSAAEVFVARGFRMPAQ
ncbi:MAG TPA: UvrD-helicase domain-containing protein [Solirubrobacteraceae bacterium]|jgi:superfamily I DNA/RNA helicase|nr:UvrD-helicase domain-containing protein [Solirubrobacteraceae bacterium]